MVVTTIIKSQIIHLFLNYQNLNIARKHSIPICNLRVNRQQILDEKKNQLQLYCPLHQTYGQTI